MSQFVRRWLVQSLYGTMHQERCCRHMLSGFTDMSHLLQQSNRQRNLVVGFLHCRAAAKAEGELIRHKAVEEAAELAAKEAAWRAKAKEMNAATKASNDTLLAFRAAERQRDKQLEAAVEGE